MNKHPKLFLIDTSSLIFRAFFAIRGLSTAKGLPTNATYGFLTMLLGVIEKNQPDYLACVLDTAAPTFRKEMFEDYKAHRGAPPDDLLPQFECIHRAIDTLGVKKLAMPGFEADDLIATLISRFKEAEVTIVTGDKDLMQLVDGRVRVLDTMKNMTYGPAEVKEKLGVEPRHITDYLGLIGDSSDNIPGIPGVGPKTAVDLIHEYGDLEQILSAASQMKEGRKRDVLIEHAETARLSKRLATVRRDVGGVCAEVELDEMRAPRVENGLIVVAPDFLRLVIDLEFKSLIKKYGGPASIGPGMVASDTVALATSHQAGAAVVLIAAKPNTVIVRNETDWALCLEKLSSQPVIAFDTETRGDRTTDLELVGMSLCGDGHESFYVPVRHQGDGTEAQISARKATADFLRLIAGKTVVAQNLKYDYKVLLAEGVDPSKNFVTGRYFDTMLAHYLVEPEEKHGLDTLAARYLNSTVGDFEQVLGERPNFSLVPLTTAAEYGSIDAWATRNLYDHLLKALREQELEKLLHEIEMPVAKVLAHMEWDGVAVDPRGLEKLSIEYAEELKGIEKEIFDLVGFSFNLNSPKQLSEVLFSKLGLPVIQKTKTGFSTDVTVLQKLAPLHPVPAQIVRYRELTKLKSTYVDVIPSLIEKDGRVHANFNQAVTATGRLSSSEPNLQNIPIKTDSGRRIRKAFIPAEGRCLLALIIRKSSFASWRI